MNSVKVIRSDEQEVKMFENSEEILSIAIGGCMFLSTLTGWAVSLVRKGKNKKLAKTGEIKKESVMAYIQSRCAEKNIKFGAGCWSDRVEKLVNILNATGS